jgi:DNA gyrase subunit A
MNFEDIGVEINRYFTSKGRIVALMKLPSLEILKSKDDDLCIIFITKNGLAKKVPISEFKKITDFKVGITLNSDDEVASALFSFDKSSKDCIICTNLGDGIRIPISDIKTLGKQAKGVRQISLKDDEYVVNACRISPNKKLLFYITSSGRIKLTEIRYFPVMQRKDEPLSLIGLDKNETLVGISSVTKNDTVIVYRKNSEPVEISLKDIKPTTRIAKGEKMVKTPKGDKVIAYKVFG